MKQQKKSKKKIRFTREERLKLFKDSGWRYNAETGEVHSHTGHLINSTHKSGYIDLSISHQGVTIHAKAHQFAWFMAHGEVSDEVDHINWIQNDNKLINLRNGTHQQNMFSLQGTKGYTWCKKHNQWKVQIVVNGTNIHLGYFDLNKEQDAAAAYQIAKEKYHSNKQLIFKKRRTKGYCWDKRRNKWKSYITVNRKTIHLGYWDRVKDASKSFQMAKKKYRKCLIVKSSRTERRKSSQIVARSPLPTLIT